MVVDFGRARVRVVNVTLRTPKMSTVLTVIDESGHSGVYAVVAGPNQDPTFASFVAISKRR